MLDLDLVRASFPALQTPWALMDNAGGSAPCRQVIDRVRQHLERLPVQLGASYALSVEAREAVAQGRDAAATLLGAEPDEIVLGASVTVLVQQLATALRASWQEGDEVVVTNLDHEANIGPWRRLEQSGITLREWRFRDETVTLHPEDLVPLLNERTRLVAFTHCSNVVGTQVDVGAVSELARAAGALTCVDGVAFAPHRRVDVRELGVDFYLVSLYKVYGPHLGMMFGRRELLRGLDPPNHFFIPGDAIPARLEPGNANYELTASLVGILEYLQTLDPELQVCFERIAEHEERLVRPLLDFLAGHPRVSLIGSPCADRYLRVPTVSFTVDGRCSSEIPPLLDTRLLATRYGHFYAYRLIRDLQLLDRDGVVRVSLVHYNTAEEITRLIEALDALL